MPETKDPIRIGGLMRCCIDTYSEIAPPSHMTKEGDTLRCNWCSSRMVIRDGAWEWDSEFDADAGGRGDS